MYGHGRWVGHKDVGAKGPDDLGDRYQELIALYNKNIAAAVRRVQTGLIERLPCSILCC
jgi:hypothetical protein